MESAEHDNLNSAEYDQDYDQDEGSFEDSVDSHGDISECVYERHEAGDWHELSGKEQAGIGAAVLLVSLLVIVAVTVAIIYMVKRRNGRMNSVVDLHEAVKGPADISQEAPPLPKKSQLMESVNELEPAKLHQMFAVAPPAYKSQVDLRENGKEDAEPRVISPPPSYY